MGVTLRDLLDDRSLGMRSITNRVGNAEVSWAHASDLDDPSPFLESGQMLLTTGRQFATFQNDDDYRDYVQRLADRGIVALGFGTEVLRFGTPPELVRACERAKVALVEVPYATPFIAVIKFVADRLAAESRHAVEQALSWQEAISNAVLSAGGLAAAVKTAAAQLDCKCAVLDSDGGVLEGSAPQWLRERALQLLRRGNRARDSGDDDSRWIVQTLGRSGRLSGAIVVSRQNHFSSTDASVITMLTALTELALEHAEDQRLGFRSIAQQLFQLLREGRIDAVREALAYHPVQLPSEPFHVLALDAREAPPALQDSLERMAVGLERRLFVVLHEENLVLLVDPTSMPHMEKKLQRSAVRVGASAQANWAGLSEALVQASAALAGAPSGCLVTFDDLRADTVVGLLDRPQVAELAQLRLGQLLASPAGQTRLREAALWLSLNGAWDPAARELGLHRHSLKLRINDLGRDLDMPLETFRGRAELWALLVSVRLIT